MARKAWYRLDNIGKFYSSQAGSPTQTVFRYSATLVDDVDPAVLQEALLETVGIFPSFNVCLRSGMFWHYLEQSDEPPAAVPETLPVCFGLHVDAKSVLFRVSYYRSRVNFEVSHIISDGRGSLSFFKALLYLYLSRRYGIEGVEVEYDGSDYQKVENSFDKYFERGKSARTRTPRAFRLGGWRDEADPTFMEYHLPVRPVLDLAHACGVSLTSYVMAVLIAAFRDEMSRRDRARPICIDVPVDLRQHFKSTTAKNFFGLVFVTYDAAGEDESVEAIAKQVNDQLRASVDPEHLKLRMNRMVELEKNPLLRFAPLFLKDFVLSLADRLAANDTTTTVSNLGAIRVDERLAPYIRDINILTSTVGIKLTMCSFQDDLSIGITSAYSNLNVVKNFCRHFSGLGIGGRMNISKTREEVAEDHAEVAFEESVRRLGDQVAAHGEARKEGGR